jgi:small subunit ribosomal protein S6
MAKIDTRNYETIFILDSAAEEDRIESQIQKYVNFLTKNKSEIVNIDRWGRRKFAYPIKKKHTGYYVSIEFTSGPGMIAKLDRNYHLDDNVLRYLTVSYDRKTMGERKTYFEKKQLEQAAKEQEAAEEQSAEKEKKDETVAESSSEENKV